MVNFNNVVYRSEHASETLAMLLEEEIDKDILRVSNYGERKYTFDVTDHQFLYNYTNVIRNEALECVAKKYRTYGFTVQLYTGATWSAIEIAW